MRGFGSSLEQISNKLLSAEAAVEVVKPGHRVFVGTASASPFTLVEALERRKPTPPDVELFYFLTTGLGPLWVEQQSAYHHRCFFVGSEARALVQSGQAEYVPISLTQIPYLTANGRIRTDVAFVQVSPPDAHGFRQSGHHSCHRDECAALRQDDRRRSQSLHAADPRRYVPSR